tara:strand:+ start:1158 stop:1358 length:201 start_codon:yes stop_codon:yes gene_type:complete
MNTELLVRQQFIKDNIDVNLDKDTLLKEAQWQVTFYEKEVIRSYEKLELAKLALKQLESGYEAQLQ